MADTLRTLIAFLFFGALAFVICRQLGRWINAVIDKWMDDWFDFSS